METSFIIAIAIIAVVILLFLLCIQFLGVWRYHDVMKNAIVLENACAGSQKVNTPKDVELINLRKDEFHTSSGKVLRYDDYKCFIVSGNSMLLGGIIDGDLIFTKPVDNVSNLQFPSILVLKREEKALDRAARVNDYAQNKVRRSWAICDLSKDDVETIVRNCIGYEEFLQLKSTYPDKFPNDEFMIEDFKERLKCYKTDYPSCCDDSDVGCMAIISTTLDTPSQKVHFSIHPARSIEGEVFYSFHLDSQRVA